MITCPNECGSKYLEVEAYGNYERNNAWGPTGETTDACVAVVCENCGFEAIDFVEYDNDVVVIYDPKTGNGEVSLDAFLDNDDYLG